MGASLRCAPCHVTRGVSFPLPATTTHGRTAANDFLFADDRGSSPVERVKRVSFTPHLPPELDAACFVIEAAA